MDSLFLKNDRNAQLPEAIYRPLHDTNITGEAADTLHVYQIEFPFLRVGAKLLKAGTILLIGTAHLIAVDACKGKRLIAFDHVLVDLVLGLVTLSLARHFCGCPDVGYRPFDPDLILLLNLPYDHTLLLPIFFL